MWGPWDMARRVLTATSEQSADVRAIEAPLDVPKNAPKEKPAYRTLIGVSPGARQAIQITGLYMEPEPEALRHAKALLEFIRGECPEMVGKYVPQPHLMRTYFEFCELEGWSARHWTAIGRQLATMTERKCVKRHGKRFRVYRIPKAPKRRRLLPALVQGE